MAYFVFVRERNSWPSPGIYTWTTIRVQRGKTYILYRSTDSFAIDFFYPCRMRSKRTQNVKKNNLADSIFCFLLDFLPLPLISFFSLEFLHCTREPGEESLVQSQYKTSSSLVYFHLDMSRMFVQGKHFISDWDKIFGILPLYRMFLFLFVTFPQRPRAESLLCRRHTTALPFDFSGVFFLNIFSEVYYFYRMDFSPPSHLTRAAVNPEVIL